MKALEQIILDGIEALWGVRVEPHQIIAIARARLPWPNTVWKSPRGVRATDWLPWAEIVRQAYEETKGRRRSRAERSGTACGKVTDRHWPGMPNEVVRRCCRKAKHTGVCSPGVTRYPPAPGARVGRR